ncbi:MAG TPA: periplasmic heavy metal sensor [Chlorobaculum parvum]|uniref:Periplasmic heavy metal sensor n=1 Tax=Chlorobaculum parvum TaxID=274539 RepID=A0A7C5DDU6_9CHLB|nr:periplasmic heavy metal sensor [Chlorobaculum parvum]
MKKTIITTALLAGFIGAAGTASAANNDRQAPCPFPSVSRSADAPGYGMRPDARAQKRASIKQALNLSDRQERKMVELRQNFFTRSRPVVQDLINMRRELALESVRKHPNKMKIDKLTRRIGQVHEQLAEMQSRHLHNVASVLDDKQLDRFMHMKDQRGDRHWKRS